MIKNLIQKMMLGGIAKYARINQTDESNIQIYIQDTGEEQLQYKIAVGWNPTEEVTFLDILDAKIDALGQEAISTPYIRQSIAGYAAEQNVEISDISVFMYRHMVGDKPIIAIAVYCKTQNIKTLTISQYLSEIGLD